MKKSSIKKEKWVNERVTMKYNVEKKKLGVELYYENGTLQDIIYGAMNGNIIWSNMIHAHLLIGLLKKVKDKKIRDAIIAKEKKVIKEQKSFRESEVDKMKQSLHKHKQELCLLEKRTKMLEEAEEKLGVKA